VDFKCFRVGEELVIDIMARGSCRDTVGLVNVKHAASRKEEPATQRKAAIL
jgi:hypothetical protein